MTQQLSPSARSTIPLGFRNKEKEAISGTLISSAPGSSSSSSSSQNHVAIICHGMMLTQTSLFYPGLADSILTNCSHLIQHIYRFDFSGHGQSEGEFLYGGYLKYVNEIASAVQLLKQNGLKVTHLIGHSMSANIVLMYGSNYSDISHIVALSPRYDMMVDERFNKQQLMTLIRDGVMYWKVKGKDIPITLQTYHDRLATDMSCVRKIGQKSEQVHTLLLHGTTDEVIPFPDACSIHQWMTAQKELNGEMDASAAESMCRIESNQFPQRLSAASFQPNITSRPHTFIPFPNVNHNYNTDHAFNAMSQTICIWINAHSCLEAKSPSKSNSPNSKSQPSPADPTLFQQFFPYAPRSMMAPSAPSQISPSNSPQQQSLQQRHLSASANGGPPLHAKRTSFIEVPSQVVDQWNSEVESLLKHICLQGTLENDSQQILLESILEKMIQSPMNAANYVKLFKKHLTSSNPIEGVNAVYALQYLFDHLKSVRVDGGSTHPFVDGIANTYFLKNYLIKPMPKEIRKPNAVSVMNRIFGGDKSTSSSPGTSASSNHQPIVAIDPSSRRWSAIKSVLQSWSEDLNFPVFGELYAKMKQDGCVFDERPMRTQSPGLQPQQHHAQIEGLRGPLVLQQPTSPSSRSSMSSAASSPHHQRSPQSNLSLPLTPMSQPPSLPNSPPMTLPSFTPQVLLRDESTFRMIQREMSFRLQQFDVILSQVEEHEIPFSTANALATQCQHDSELLDASMTFLAESEDSPAWTNESVMEELINLNEAILQRYDKFEILKNTAALLPLPSAPAQSSPSLQPQAIQIDLDESHSHQQQPLDRSYTPSRTPNSHQGLLFDHDHEPGESVGDSGGYGHERENSFSLNGHSMNIAPAGQTPSATPRKEDGGVVSFPSSPAIPLSFPLNHPSSASDSVGSSSSSMLNVSDAEVTLQRKRRGKPSASSVESKPVSSL